MNSIQSIDDITIVRAPCAEMWMSYVYVFIREIYVQIYYGNFKSEKRIVIHAKCTIWTISTSPWHEIYSTYQFLGYGSTELDTI